MNVELEEKLSRETERALEHAKTLKPDTEMYQELMEQIRKNCDVLNKLDQIGYEEARAVDDRIAARELKELELRAKKKEGRVNTAVAVAGMLVPTVLTGGLYLYMYEQGLKFEEHGAVTSTFFRNVLNKVKPT